LPLNTSPRWSPWLLGLVAILGSWFLSLLRRVRRKEDVMADSVYKVIELVGTSTESWEKAATAAITKASKSLHDLRIAEVSQLDIQLEGGKVHAYRAKVKVSFKYEDKD
jgi:flavin-binding protein dodecin